MIYIREGGNMKKDWLIKTLTFCIVVLFISVSIQPVFAVNLKNNDKSIDYEYVNVDKIKYIIEIIREDEVIEHTVFLTKEKANDLDILIEDIRFKLDNSRSTEDTYKIFYDTVDSFNSLGVFPENISIGEIKDLITGKNRDINKINFKKEMNDGFENRFCFISSNTTNTFSLGPIVLLSILAFIPFAIYASFFDNLEHNFNLSRFKLLTKLFMIPYYLLYIPFLSLTICSYLSVTSRQPVSIGSLITFGYCKHSLDPWGYDEYYPSNGWIFTIGLSDIKSYNGDFYGGLSKILAIFWDFYNGITGFTGISIRKPDNSIFRLGFGLQVNIDNKYVV